VTAAHIGIVACSAEGAALCYRTICADAPRRMGEQAHPEISMHTHPLSEYMTQIRAGNWGEVAGTVTEDSRLFFNQVADRLGARGADAMVLGCTEIPLLVRPDDCPLPTLDSTRLLARAALDRALS
jgi:aspartate racemase